MISKNLISFSQPKSPVTEAYRMLRTNIYFSDAEKKLQVIVITSPDKGEGKSTTGGNLAITLAKDNHKVLFMDCDLRKPRVHKYFMLDNEQGITNILVENLEIESDKLLPIYFFVSIKIYPSGLLLNLNVNNSYAIMTLKQTNFIHKWTFWRIL